MTTPAAVERWMDLYRAAWTSNDPDDVTALFTEDAVYHTRPFDPSPWRGHTSIVMGWLEHNDEPGTWSFDWTLIGLDGNTAFVQGETNYQDEPDYDNLWVVRLADDGRAEEFTEWFMVRD